MYCKFQLSLQHSTFSTEHLNSIWMHSNHMVLLIHAVIKGESPIGKHTSGCFVGGGAFWLITICFLTFCCFTFPENCDMARDVHTLTWCAESWTAVKLVIDVLQWSSSRLSNYIGWALLTELCSWVHNITTVISLKLSPLVVDSEAFWNKSPTGTSIEPNSIF